VSAQVASDLGQLGVTGCFKTSATAKSTPRASAVAYVYPTGRRGFETTSKFDLMVNLATARSLGLTLPQSDLQQATEIIQ
jgi:hypothetical protein